MADKYKTTSLLALRLPDGTLVPVWNASHAKEIAMKHHGIPEVVIEKMEIRRIYD